MSKKGFKVVGEYAVMSDWEIPRLVEKVNLCLEKGWRVHGSLACGTSGRVLQPLVRNKTIPLTDEDLNEDV